MNFEPLSSTTTVAGASQPPKSRLRRRYWVPFAAAALGAALVSSVPQTARASFLPAEATQVIDFINEAAPAMKAAKSALDLFNRLLGLGSTAPDKFEQVQTKIVDEIRFWVDVRLDATADAAARKYDELLRNPNQNALDQERILYLTGSSSSNDASDLFLELERLILDTSNLDRSVDLSLPYNTLAQTMGHAMRLYEVYFPGEAAFSWWSYDDLYGRTLRANYTLVGARAVECHPGFFPGQGHVVADRDRTLQYSRLFKRLENKRFAVGTYNCVPTRDDEPEDPFTHTLEYNPVTHAFRAGCSGLREEANVTIGSAVFPFLGDAAAAGAQRGLDRATVEFLNDSKVDSLRSANLALLGLAGGDELAGGGDINEGQYFDPWVNELDACGANNPWAYIARR
jgi:hypothetical protein